MSEQNNPPQNTIGPIGCIAIGIVILFVLAIIGQLAEGIDRVFAIMPWWAHALLTASVFYLAYKYLDK